MKTTPREAEIYNLLTIDGLSTREAAHRLKISRGALRTLYKRAKKKLSQGGRDTNRGGLLPPRDTKKEGGGIQKEGLIRLHNLQFHISLSMARGDYNKLRGRVVRLDRETLAFGPKSVEVYSTRDFYAGSSGEAMREALGFYLDWFLALEKKFNLVFIKSSGWVYASVVRKHFAMVGNEFARDTQARGEMLVIKAPEDGKAWLITDKSLGVPELETVHPKTSQEDMERVKPFFDDLRQNGPFKLSELLNAQVVTVKQLAEVSAGLNSVVQVLRLLNPGPGVPVETKGGRPPDYVG